MNSAAARLAALVREADEPALPDMRVEDLTDLLIAYKDKIELLEVRRCKLTPA